MTVRIHCVGRIDAAKLEIPLRFTAGVGGRLAQLADFHEHRRREALRVQADLTRQEATAERLLSASQSTFGPASPTQPAPR